MTRPTEAFKLVDASEWAAALAQGVYTGSAVDRADGYIHMSTASQLAETARRHYAGRGQLLLLTVPIEGLGKALVWEPSRGGDLFPHLYAPLAVSAVTAVRACAVSPEGTMRFEDEPRP
ncbi:DUF952 domain-containing protein [Stigmatella erecta]|uniref:Uncharacterized conserved protein, DUF952 family n=1 Tax=Stigmatella erecta TaxID=83460 RepID=A0A1I0L7L6_9BACT|nr:DUF952 domain-containing protein [Stigmatella erecta]SEU35226.1 Uncharacterized conserved protein, DUF952 family [Stigmatella erecta]